MATTEVRHDVVTGASGRLGSRVLEHVLQRVPAEQVGVSVRDTAEVEHLAGRGVRVRRGDFTDPGSLAAAFEGATQVLLVSAAIRGEADATTAHRLAVDAARAAGAERVLCTSHQGAAEDSELSPTRGHAATQQHLAATGGAFTALRNGFYATTLPPLVARSLTTGTLAAPADGPVSWTAHDDLAEAAATALTAPGRLDGVSPPLTASEALDLSDVAALLSDVTGRRVERVVVDDEEWAADQVGRGVPAAAAELLLGMFRASRRGELAVTDPALAELLGRPTTSLRPLLEDAVAGR